MNADSLEQASPLRLNWKIIGSFCGMALLTLVLCQLNYSHTVAPEAGVTLDLPERVGDFRGKDQPISEGERVILPQGTEFAKMGYDDSSGDLVSCQIVLSAGDKRSIHRPEICLPGQGWTIQNQQTVPIALKSGRLLEVRRLSLVRQVQTPEGGNRPLKMVFLYWFVGNHFMTADHKQRILRTNLDMLLYSRAHRWAYVIFSAPVLEGFKYEGKNEEQTFAMLSDFLRASVPSFLKQEMELSNSAPVAN